MNTDAVPSPCRALCNLNNDGYCSGCFRSSADITYWTTYSNEEKRQAIRQAEQRERDQLNNPQV